MGLYNENQMYHMHSPLHEMGNISAGGGNQNPLSQFEYLANGSVELQYPDNNSSNYTHHPYSTYGPSP